MARDQVGDDHVFGAQAGGLHDAPGVLRRGALQHRHGMGDAVVEAGGDARIKIDRNHDELRSSYRRSGVDELGAPRAHASASAVPGGIANSGRLSRTSPW